MSDVIFLPLFYGSKHSPVSFVVLSGWVRAETRQWSTVFGFSGATYGVLPR